jgi:hypothetical protein
MKTAHKGRGRPKINHEQALVSMFGAIEEVRVKSQSKRITDACAAFAKTPRGKGHPASYYETRYHEGRKLFQEYGSTAEGLARLLF